VEPESTRLAEFQALRDEEMRCMDSQRDLVKLNITASGTIAALAIADTTNPGLLVILAFLSPVLGLLWIDQDSKIHRIGRYIREVLWMGWEPSWEAWLKGVKEEDTLTRVAAYAVPVVVVFLLPSIAGLIVSGKHTSHIGGWGVWITALVPTVGYAVIGAIYLVKRGRSTARG
jgi:hypothetical protein